MFDRGPVPLDVMFMEASAAQPFPPDHADALDVLPPAAAPLLDAERLQALCAMPYRDYLRSPEWTVARDAAITRAGARCALDPDHVEGLEVLHRNYDRLGVERHTDLVVLCADCRARHEARTGGRSRRPHIRPRAFDEASA